MSQQHPWEGRQFKGASRIRKAMRSAEARIRDASTQHQRTRRHRLGKCGCRGEES